MLSGLSGHSKIQLFTSGLEHSQFKKGHDQLIVPGPLFTTISLLYNMRLDVGLQLIALALLIGSANGLWDFVRIPAVQKQEIETCGNTIEQARSHGCHFDIMSFAYYPPQCWDPDLSARWIEDYRHTWNWTRLDGTPISVDDVLKGDHESLVSTWEFHSQHCLYEWERLIRAVAFAKRLDGKDGNFGHATHCGWELLREGKAEGKQELLTTLTVYYAQCGLTSGEMRWLGKYHSEE